MNNNGHDAAADIDYVAGYGIDDGFGLDTDADNALVPATTPATAPT